MTNLQELAPIKLRGKIFTELELAIIKSCVREHYVFGRTSISKAICEKLDWRQPNGWLKDRACRDVMLRLDEMQIIKLPPPLIKRNRKNKSYLDEKDDSLLAKFDLTSPVTDYPNQVKLIFAKGNVEEKVWNNLVSRYHYLGHRVIVGRHIKYLIKSDDILLGAIGFSSPSWHLYARDLFLTNLGIDNPHDYTINNARFLILPNVQVKNLASHVLSLATKKVIHDWTWYYSITPLVAETFVQPSLYNGTCYKAANWIEIGMTKGYAKRGASFRNSQEPKKIFLYGLNKQVRRQLWKMFARN